MNSGGKTAYRVRVHQPTRALSASELEDAFLLHELAGAFLRQGSGSPWVSVAVNDGVAMVVRHVTGLGDLIAAKALGSTLGWTAQLLRWSASRKPRLHHVVDFNGWPLNCGSELRARKLLDQIADDPWGWLWKPVVDGEAHLNGRWTFHVGYSNWDDRQIRAIRQTRRRLIAAAIESANVTLFQGGDRWSLEEDASPLLDPGGHTLIFPNLSVARRYVEDNIPML